MRPKEEVEEFAIRLIDRYPTVYDDTFWNKIDEYLQPMITKNGEIKKIGDYGHGPGTFAIDFFERYGYKEYVGFDYSQFMQDIAMRELQKGGHKLLLEKVKFELVDLQVPPFNDLEGYNNQFDLIFCGYLFRALEPSLSVLNLWYNQIKKGGLLIIYDWTRFELSQWIEMQKNGTLDEITGIQWDEEELITRFRSFSRYSPEDLSILAKMAGFKVKDILKRQNGLTHIAIFSK